MMTRTIAICDEKINDNIDDNYVVRTETAKMAKQNLRLKRKAGTNFDIDEHYSKEKELK